MTKFKVGDKVKIVENSSNFVNAVGEIGVIIYMDFDVSFFAVSYFCGLLRLPC